MNNFSLILSLLTEKSYILSLTIEDYLVIDAEVNKMHYLHIEDSFCFVMELTLIWDKKKILDARWKNLFTLATTREFKKSMGNAAVYPNQRRSALRVFDDLENLLIDGRLNEKLNTNVKSSVMGLDVYILHQSLEMVHDFKNSCQMCIPQR